MIKFEAVNDQKINIMKNGKKIGHIFSPSGSGETNLNAIQIGGFTEAFDLWGSGVFQGTKNIQLLFDDQKMKGSHVQDLIGSNECLRCFMKKCQCEVRAGGQNPFLVKRQQDLKDRIKTKKGDE